LPCAFLKTITNFSHRITVPYNEAAKNPLRAIRLIPPVGGFFYLKIVLKLKQSKYWQLLWKITNIQLSITCFRKTPYRQNFPNQGTYIRRPGRFINFHNYRIHGGRSFCRQPCGINNRRCPRPGRRHFHGYGAFLASEAEHQVRHAELVKERAANRHSPEEEKEEMLLLFEHEGVPKHNATAIVEIWWPAKRLSLTLWYKRNLALIRRLPPRLWPTACSRDIVSYYFIYPACALLFFTG